MAGEFLQGSALALDPTAVETLPGLVCRASRRAVSESMGHTLYLHRLDQIDALSWQWIDHHENLVEQVWHTQQGVFRRKRPPNVRDDPMRGQ